MVVSSTALCGNCRVESATSEGGGGSFIIVRLCFYLEAVNALVMMCLGCMPVRLIILFALVLSADILQVLFQVFSRRINLAFQLH